MAGSEKDDEAKIVNARQGNLSREDDELLSPRTMTIHVGHLQYGNLSGLDLA